MNEQKPPNAIEWTRVRNADGTMRRGFTWNVVTGCFHRCEWNMPDGKVAACYAGDIARGVARNAYPHGFEHHYYHPERLSDPLKMSEPAGIFLDSQSDLMGHWVDENEIRAVLSVVRQAEQHIFFLLTKNSPRLLKFKDEFPANLWVGASMPPSSFMGKPLHDKQQEAMFAKTLDVMGEIEGVIRWISFEPLSFDVSSPMWKRDCPIDWAVIGAASRGREKYQPNPAHVGDLLRVLNTHHVPVFFKGNLEWPTWREEFPTGRIEAEPVPAPVPAQLSMF